MLLHSNYGKPSVLKASLFYNFIDATVAELADAHVWGACGRPYGFKSHQSHQKRIIGRSVDYFFVFLLIWEYKKFFGGFTNEWKTILNQNYFCRPLRSRPFWPSHGNTGRLFTKAWMDRRFIDDNSLSTIFRRLCTIVCLHWWCQTQQRFRSHRLWWICIFLIWCCFFLAYQTWIFWWTACCKRRQQAARLCFYRLFDFRFIYDRFSNRN